MAKSGWGFAVVVVAGGVVAGAAGALLTLLLCAIQQVAFGYSDTTFLLGVEHADLPRRLIAPLLGCAVAGVGWWLLRQRTEIVSVRAAVANPAKPLTLWPTLADAVLQIVAVGCGASMGREGAPRQAAAAVVDKMARAFDLPVEQRRILLASAAGAGLSAVYNVPLSGVAFTFEILALTLGWQAGLASIVMCGLGTIVAWPVITNQPIYQLVTAPVSGWLWVWAVALMPLCALLGLAFRFLMRTPPFLRRLPTWALPLTVGAAGGLVGLAAWWWPQLPGNGKGIAQVAFAGGGGLALFAALVVLKPLATSIARAAGTTGGLLTPALSTGAAAGGVLAVIGQHHQLGGSSLPYLALLGGVGVLACTQKAPVFAAIFGFELTRPPVAMIGPLLLVAVGAFLLAQVGARWLGALVTGPPSSPQPGA